MMTLLGDSAEAIKLPHELVENTLFVKFRVLRPNAHHSHFAHGLAHLASSTKTFAWAQPALHLALNDLCVTLRVGKHGETLARTLGSVPDTEPEEVPSLR